nr:RNA polymerase sigma factor [Burkholderia cenocepacia]
MSGCRARNGRGVGRRDQGGHVGQAGQAVDDRAADDARARGERFRALVLPHLDAAYNLARWLSGSAGDADDVVQDACMRALRFVDSCRGDNARPWLLTIVRHTWYTEWRRRTQAHEVALPDTLDDADVPDDWQPATGDPLAHLLRGENVRLVNAALAKLPAEHREVLVLREMEDLSYREIAAIVDVPVGTVMSRLARGRRKLAALLGGAPAPATEGRPGRAPAGGTASEAIDGL